MVIKTATSEMVFASASHNRNVLHAIAENKLTDFHAKFSKKDLFITTYERLIGIKINQPIKARKTETSLHQNRLCSTPLKIHIHILIFMRLWKKETPSMESLSLCTCRQSLTPSFHIYANTHMHAHLPLSQWKKLVSVSLSSSFELQKGWLRFQRQFRQTVRRHMRLQLLRAY